MRSYLKRFLFSDDRITTQVKKLSGGERSRLLLARILKSGGNFLILDEPTNDLDLPTLRVLEEALIAFPGMVLVVSHDRYFLNRVCTDILAFEGDGKIHHSVGDYDYYLEKKQKAEMAAKRAADVASSLWLEQTQKIRPQTGRYEAKAAQTFLQGTARTRRHGSADSRGRGRSRAHRRLVRRSGIFPQARGASEPAHAELDAAKANVPKLYARWEELEAIKSASEVKSPAA